MRKQRIEPRRPKLPPILEIDDDGLGLDEVQAWTRPQWNADDDAPRGLSLGEWPTEFDD